MASHGTHRVLIIVAIAVASLLVIAAAAAAVISGVVQFGKPVSAVGEVRTATPEPTASATLELVPRTPSPSPSATPVPTTRLPATSQATFEAPPPPEPAVVPEVVQTVQARVPEIQPTTAPEPKTVCPSGAVTSGLTDVKVQNKREWIVGHLVDLVGHGRIHNGTTAAVEVSLYLPYIKGLDASGELTMNSFAGDFDYNPPPGTPRPGTISLPAGETLTYTFTAKDVTSDDMRETVAWHADPEENVWHYSDIQMQIDCPDVVVTPHPGGPGIPNTFVIN